MTRTGMVCSACGKPSSFSYEDVRCACGGTKLVRYDLEAVARTFNRQSLAGRGASMWRYRELLPVASADSIVTLGEGWTPLSRIEARSAVPGIRQLWMKREELNPTGSFKARGLSAAVSLLKERGVRRAAIGSNGNAAAALAAYAGAAGIEAYVFVPEDCPPLIIKIGRAHV